MSGCSSLQQRVTVSGFIFFNDKVLLLKRAQHEKFLPGYFDLPGGKVNLGESPSLSVLREVFEECGLETKIINIYNVWDWVSAYKNIQTQFVSISYALTLSGKCNLKLSSDFDSYVLASEQEIYTLKITDNLRADLLKGFKNMREHTSCSIYNETELLRNSLQDGIGRLVVGMVVRNNLGEVLILQRPKNDFMGDLWELPSGKVERGETLSNAVERELNEETNLKLTEIVKYIGSFDYSSKSGAKTRQFNFQVHVDLENVHIIHPEHTSYAWVQLTNLHNYNISNEIKNILQTI